MAAEGFHEDDLPEDAQEFHRMIQSVIEELEAVDWYNQRAEATNDPDVQAIVEHNRDEEIEHACMGLEWLRRNNPVWDEMLRTFLFQTAKITEIEEEGEAEEGESEKVEAPASSKSLGLGNMKGGE